MKQEDYQWHINMVKDRYHNLNLTIEQAEHIHNFEKERDTASFSENHYFSVWEEWDYEIAAFRQILNNDQLKVYEEYMNKNIKRHENWLIEQDFEKTKEIAYYEELLEYYEKVFLPELVADPHIIWYAERHPDNVKINFLKSEYKFFLNDRKQQILKEHFRHNRLFKPNELQATLIRHKISYLWPDYSSFQHSCDDATKAVLEYMTKRIRSLPEKTENLLSKKLADLKTFNNNNFNKYYGDVKGWHVVTGQLTPEEEKQHREMTLILIDIKKNGCDI